MDFWKLTSGWLPYSALLGSTVDACHVSSRRLVQTAQTAVSPQLQFIFGRRHPLRFAVADFHGPDCLSDHRDSPVLLDKVVNALLCKACRSST